MVPRAGLEPARIHHPWDFKSHVSTYFTIEASKKLVTRVRVELTTP